MADFIDRQALGIGKCNPKVFENKAYAEGWNSAISIIESAPAADVRPERHGEWVRVSDDDQDEGWFICLECKEKYYNPSDDEDLLPNFCPRCGAKMDRKDGSQC